MHKTPQPSARPITKTDFRACMGMTALFFFIVGGLVAEALSAHQARHLKYADYDRQAQSQVDKP